jgi:hypothetical protein
MGRILKLEYLKIKKLLIRTNGIDCAMEGSWTVSTIHIKGEAGTNEVYLNGQIIVSYVNDPFL